MLYQVHWQYKDGSTDIRAQKDIGSNDEMKAWIDELWKTQPPPEGAIYMICNERSKHFVGLLKGGAG